jgi:hypothetical protein
LDNRPSSGATAQIPLDLGEPQKSNKRSMPGTIVREAKREGQRKAKRPAQIKKRRERASPLGRKLFHSRPF